MKEYILLEDSRITKYLILSLSYVSPLDDIDSLEEELAMESIKGQVVFDLLLCNGIEHNRYVEIEFDGKHFKMESMRILDDIDSISKSAALKYYREHPIYLENSILPKAQVFLIKKGELI